MLTDAIGLAAFTISGIFVTILANLSPLWIWGPFFSLITAAGGGMIRDILAGRKIVSLSGAIYTEWAVLGGLFFAIYIDMNALSITKEVVSQGIILTIFAVFFCRIFSYIFNIKNISFK